MCYVCIYVDLVLKHSKSLLFVLYIIMSHQLKHPQWVQASLAYSTFPKNSGSSSHKPIVCSKPPADSSYHSTFSLDNLGHSPFNMRHGCTIVLMSKPWSCSIALSNTTTAPSETCPRASITCFHDDAGNAEFLSILSFHTDDQFS